VYGEAVRVGGVQHVLGASVVRDVSGSAVIQYGTDGSQTWYRIGPFAVGFHAGNQGHRSASTASTG
jgi:hypothetical protein